MDSPAALFIHRMKQPGALNAICLCPGIEFFNLLIYSVHLSVEWFVLGSCVHFYVHSYQQHLYFTLPGLVVLVCQISNLKYEIKGQLVAIILYRLSDLSLFWILFCCNSELHLYQQQWYFAGSWTHNLLESCCRYDLSIKMELDTWLSLYWKRT